MSVAARKRKRSDSLSVRFSAHINHQQELSVCSEPANNLPTLLHIAAKLEIFAKEFCQLMAVYL
jgi:hypothetical protein